MRIAGVMLLCAESLTFTYNSSELFHMPKNADHRPPQTLQGPVADEIDIMTVLRIFYARRFSLFVGGLTGALAGLVLSFVVPDLYTSTVRVSPVSGNAMNSMLQQYGGLASLAGISIPQSGGGDKTDLALATLESDDFISEFIAKHQFEADLLAAVEWSRESGQMRYDSDLIDADGNLISGTEFESELLTKQLLDRFNESLSVSQDKTTGFITLRFTHVSPRFAGELLSLLVSDVNARLRGADIAEARAAIDYLENYAQEVGFAEVKEAIYGLIQSQIETVMLANVRVEYALRIIDGPSRPVLRSSPKRAVYLVSGAILGSLLILIASGLVVLRESLREDR